MKTTSIIYALLPILIGLTASARAQTIFTGFSGGINDSITLRTTAGDPDEIKLPVLLHPSPEVQAMTRYGDYPVGMNTGVADISIPLYEIRSGSLTLPISMKFHPSGRRPEEKEGILGYGWTLDAGGIVSRTLRGWYDEDMTKPTLTKEQIASVKAGSMGKYKLLAGISEYKRCAYRGTAYPTYDSQYDIFTYVLPSGSGKFILKDTLINNQRTKIAFMIPYRPVDVKFDIKRNTDPLTLLSYDWLIRQITITDTDGVQYIFGETPDKNNYYTEYVDPPNKGDSYYTGRLPEDRPLKYVSAWNITGIVSANRSDSVLFEYGTPQAYGKNHSISYDYKQSNLSVSDKVWGEIAIGIPYATIVAFYENPVSELEEFGAYGDSYSSCRISKISFKQGTMIFTLNDNDKMVRNITIKDKNNVIVKQIDFRYTKSTGEQVFTLSEMDVYGKIKNPAVKETYSFDYYNNRTVLANRKSKDWWGYYNGKNNDFLVPTFKIDYNNNGHSSKYYEYTKCTRIGGSVSREVSSEDRKAGMLKSIKYPTGGKTEFVYEDNKYWYSGQEHIGPGLRIQKIINTSGDGSETYKEYQYTNGRMSEYLHPTAENFMLETKSKLLMTNARTSWLDIGQMSFRTRTFFSDMVLETTGLTPQYVHYDRVTEWVGLNTHIEGLTEYQYSTMGYNYDEAGEPDVKTYKYFGIMSSAIDHKTKYLNDEYCWKGGKLKYKTEFKNNGNGFTKVRETAYHYFDYIKESRSELCANKAYVYIDNTTHSSQESLCRQMEEDEGDEVFCHAIKKYISGAELLHYTEELQYNETGSPTMTICKYNEYEPLHFFLSKETIAQTTTSLNDNYTLSSTYTYPFQLNTSPYNEMTAVNMLTPVVERSRFRNDQFLEKKTTGFKNWGTGLFAPELIQVLAKGQSTPETRIKYEKYDACGNPVYITRDGYERVFYIWGYNSQYPIAEIKNVPYSSVIGRISENTLQTIAAKNRPSSSDWELINGLRKTLPNAVITTVMYEPLIGIVTVIDPVGQATTFEYEDLNRLKSIKDNAGNKKESYDYHFKN